MRGISILLVIILFIQLELYAQQDSTSRTINTTHEELIEDFLQNQEEESPFEFNTIFEELVNFRNDPLNLNTASREDLQELLLLSDVQINQLVLYRRLAGNLLALEELQAVPGFDLQTIRRILPYVQVSDAINHYPISFKKMITDGNDEFYIRWQRQLEQEAGFAPLKEGETGSRYLGDPNKLYLRYRHSYSNRLRFGLTAEKDEGESFFSGNNRKGFDFYSAHFFIKNFNKTIRALALGDFTASFGQGLLLYSGFGRGKGAGIMNIKRSQRALLPFSSVDENNFLRGAGATLSLGKHWEFTAFGSLRLRDANILEPDSLDQEEGALRFSSLQSSGLHRTLAEIADEDALQQFTLGGQLKYTRENWHLAFNGIANQFDKQLERRLRPYNQYYFNGQKLNNASLDYSYIYQNFNFFGETAISGNGAIATINGLLLTLDRRVDLSILFRHYPRHYQAINPNPIAETTGARNETGLYLGTIVRFNRFWSISAYYDSWRHPWLRFDADAPSRGNEFRLRLNYYRKRQLESYIEFRNEAKEKNAPDVETKADYLVNTRRLSCRLHTSYTINPALELRTRLDAGFYEDGFHPEKEIGLALYQDVIFRPLSFPLSFSTRFAVFDTDGYNIRFYSYENDLLYTFSIPAYFNRGTRFYLNLRYKASRMLTLELRYSQTYYANQKSIGSGLEAIEGPVRSELKAQLRFKL